MSSSTPFNFLSTRPAGTDVKRIALQYRTSVERIKLIHSSFYGNRWTMDGKEVPDFFHLNGRSFAIGDNLLRDGWRP